MVGLLGPSLLSKFPVNKMPDEQHKGPQNSKCEDDRHASIVAAHSWNATRNVVPSAACNAHCADTEHCCQECKQHEQKHPTKPPPTRAGIWVYGVRHQLMPNRGDEIVVQAGQFYPMASCAPCNPTGLDRLLT
jgi:hypothetical protein